MKYILLVMFFASTALAQAQGKFLLYAYKARNSHSDDNLRLTEFDDWVLEVYSDSTVKLTVYAPQWFTAYQLYNKSTISGKVCIDHNIMRITYTSPYLQLIKDSSAMGLRYMPDTSRVHILFPPTVFILTNGTLIDRNGIFMPLKETTMEELMLAKNNYYFAYKRIVTFNRGIWHKQ